MRETLIALIGVASLAAATSTASAQEPTELKVEEARQESSGDPDAGFVARMRRFADETQIIERLNGEVDGWYPRLGGMTTGSGFAIGPGYRTHLTDRQIYVDLSVGFTKKGYKAVDAQVEWLQRRYRTVELWTNFRYQDFPQEDYFGLGFNSLLSTRSNYALKSTEWLARGIYHARSWLRTGAELGYFSPSIASGTDVHERSTELVFTDVEAPGLVNQPDFLHTGLFAEVDYRDERGNPRSGGFYHVGFGIWDDRSFEQFDFKRLDGEAAQFFPIGSKAHVIASRVGVSYVNNTPGERVPFYMLPYVGGSQTLRGYKEFRFMDENALWWNTEYRWNAIKHLDVALFYDVAKVSPDWQGITLADARTAWGIGFRVASSKRVFARLDIGLGGEERQIFFKLGPSF